MSDLGEAQKQAIRQAFKEAVNMPPSRLRRWLGSTASQQVGMTKGGRRVDSAHAGESVGHQMGERILAIKGKRVAELEEDDYHAMRKVIGYVHRHLEQRPEGDIRDSRWRQSLMNWGHDPLAE